MTKKEIERMTSLIDERYTEEVFSTPIRSGKNFHVGWIATAAAVAITCVGGLALANSGESGVATDLQTITSETELSDFTDILVPEYSPAADPEAYFRCEPGSAIIDYAIATDWYRQYGAEETKEIMPFDFSDADSGKAYLWMDEKGSPVTATAYLSEDAARIVQIVISYKGEMLPGHPIDGCTPVERLGVPVYGFDLSHDKDGSDLMACFSTGGIGCTISVTGMSCGEAMEIVDSFILHCPTANDFLNTKAAEYKTVYGTEDTEPFTGYLPSSEVIGDMERTQELVTIETDGGAHTVLHVNYASVTEPGGGAIGLTYSTDMYDGDLSNRDHWVKLDEFTEESLAGFAVFKEDAGRYSYNFTVDAESFYIGVSAKCTPDELWQVICEIRSPFGGYLPASVTIGDMERLEDAYMLFSSPYEHDPAKEQLIYYENRESGQSIYLWYRADEEDISEEYVNCKRVQIGALTKAGLENYKDGGSYKFILEVNGFFIEVGARCTADELWQVISEIKGTTPFDEYLPQSDRIGDMELVTGGTSSQTHVYYKNPENGDYINIWYLTGIDMEKYSAELDDYHGADLDSLTRSGLADYIGEDGSYRITFPADDILIAVGAQCTPDELWQVICEIKGGTGSIGAEPYGNHVPQSAKISDMELALNNTSQDGSGGYSRYMYYCSEGGESYLMVQFLSGGYEDDLPADRPIIPLTDISRDSLEDFVTGQPTPYSDNDNCYNFIIRAEGFSVMIDGKCLEEELWQLISEIR